MDIVELKAPDEAEEAALLAAAEHGRLRTRHPVLQERDPAHFAPKIAWMMEHGRVLGIRDKTGALTCFMGFFVLEDFRNAGPGAFSPDWCKGSGDGFSGMERIAGYRALYRAFAPEWQKQGLNIHALGLYQSDHDALESFLLSGFGCIVMDAVRPLGELETALKQAMEARPLASGLTVRRAGVEDSGDLERLGAALAEHIGAAPICMPDPRGPSREEWRGWFDEAEAVAFVLDYQGKAVGFIKAQEPQFDVSDAVREPGMLGINGMYVEPAHRRGGAGRALLEAMVLHAGTRGKRGLSVDCETTNLEAYAFWTAYFTPFAWSLERRV